MTNEELLLRLQEDLLARCKADEYVGAVRCVNERKGNILEDIEQGLGLVQAGGGGKIGACVVVYSLIGEIENANAPGGALKLDVTFRVLETPATNMEASSGTLKPAISLARRLVNLFHLYTPEGLASTLTPPSNGKTIVPVRDEMADIAYEVRFECVEANDDEQSQKVARPVISADSEEAPATVTLLCGTVGASIYYTTDGSHPWSENAAATLYAAPFAVNAAAMVRAAAYKAGMIGSNVAAIELE